MVCCVNHIWSRESAIKWTVKDLFTQESYKTSVEWYALSTGQCPACCMMYIFLIGFLATQVAFHCTPVTWWVVVLNWRSFEACKLVSWLISKNIYFAKCETMNCILIHIILCLILKSSDGKPTESGQSPSVSCAHSCLCLSYSWGRFQHFSHSGFDIKQQYYEKFTEKFEQNLSLKLFGSPAQDIFRFLERETSTKVMNCFRFKDLLDGLKQI